MTEDPQEQQPSLLNRAAFEARLWQEASRVRRQGGFLSLALFGVPSSIDAERTSTTADALRRRVRAHDHLGVVGRAVAIAMPGATMPQASKAAERLLAHCPDPATLAVGIATLYGATEGGSAALFMAAEEALRSASPGTVARSQTLDGRPRVLVVDDDPGFASALAETITEHGWSADPCSDAADARQRVEGNDYVALFVDLMMPGLSGVDLLRAWIAREPVRPGILMSGYNVPQQSILDALTMGPVMFIGKPVASRDLAAALEMCRHLLPGTPATR